MSRLHSFQLIEYSGPRRFSEIYSVRGGGIRWGIEPSSTIAGVRNAAAGLNLDPDAVKANPGPLFENWVGIELYKRIRFKGSGLLSYFRTSSGIEVDFIVEDRGKLCPIEVKWTERPALSDARHLISFMKDHPGAAEHGCIVCRCPYPVALSDSITAIPWWAL